MPNNELQELLGARFEGHTQPTDESVWSAIESQLDGDKSDRAGIWFWIFNSMAATLFIGLMVQSNLRTEPLFNLSQSQLAKSMIKQETETTQISNQHEVSKGAISTDTKVKNVLTSNETSVFFADEKASISKPEKPPYIGDKNKNRTNALLDPNVRKKTETKQEITQKLPVSDLYPTNPRLGLDLPIVGTPILLGRQKSRTLKNIPIHLGFEFSYLHKTREENLSAAPPDSNYTWSNNSIEENRHFEFSFLSQFDLSKRFSVSTGLGYSYSNFKYDHPPGPNFNNLQDPIEANQRILTIPIQAKFAFIQQNRLSLSAGLTFQGEFGSILYSESIEQPDFTTIAFAGIPTQSTVVSEKRIQQLAIEPFVQLSIGISPRFSTFANFGYKRYFGKTITGNSLPKKLNYINADIGILFRIH